MSLRMDRQQLLQREGTWGHNHKGSQSRLATNRRPKKSCKTCVCSLQRQNFCAVEYNGGLTSRYKTRDGLEEGRKSKAKVVEEQGCVLCWRIMRVPHQVNVLRSRVTSLTSECSCCCPKPGANNTRGAAGAEPPHDTEEAAGGRGGVLASTIGVEVPTPARLAPPTAAAVVVLKPPGVCPASPNTPGKA